MPIDPTLPLVLQALSQAVTEAMTSASQPKFVAGVVGPSTGSLSSPKTKTTWDEMVNGYRPQARIEMLAIGNVHMIDMNLDLCLSVGWE